jgi:hypothetical protein
VTDNLEEVSENIAAVSNLCRGKELSCDTKDFVRSDDHLATHYNFEPATALLTVRNTQNKDVEDEMEVGEEAKSSSLLELLYTVKDCIQKDVNTKVWKHISLLDLWSCIQETCNVQCNRSLICAVL